MGGEFWVESEPGNGCHFRLRLPLAQRTAMAS
jgi:signal transduction histidine kinase